MKENNNLSLSDLNDSAIIRENESLLSLLLKDHTTGKNIKWGTDSYNNHGYSFRYDQEIKVDLITGWYEGFIRPRVDKDIDIQLERQRNRAEVFTPSWVIKLQVDAALKDLEELSLVDFIKTKWLEITCGEAPYMVNRYDMETGEVIPLKDRSGFIDVKFKKLNQEIEPEEEWLKLAVEIYKASYGYEYQGDSLLLARENLILTFIDNYFYMFGAFPKEKTLLEITKIISFNVFQMDGLTYEVPHSDGESRDNDTQLSLFEEIELKENITPELAKIKLWNKNKLVDIKKISERNDNNMKFDVVIGNPPYQDESTGDGTHKPPIYHYFMDESYNIAKKSLLITPARFLFNAGATGKKWNEKMLNDEYLNVLYYEKDSTKVFKNTDIKGGVAITYRDTTKDKRNPIGHFIPYEELKNIDGKVWLKAIDSLSEIIFGQNIYYYTDKMHSDYPEAEKN
ncbi:Eco57I restriction-modification methylase domain-containing protein [Jeotgalibaca porci]|uniref:Eco57I restriction-modification methylase domain-containing protein n=1 Tax=Jeotgalibaca porci TaxID=1868793 RepID=UPI003F904603